MRRRWNNRVTWVKAWTEAFYHAAAKHVWFAFGQGLETFCATGRPRATGRKSRKELLPEEEIREVEEEIICSALARSISWLEFKSINNGKVMPKESPLLKRCYRIGEDGVIHSDEFNFNFYPVVFIQLLVCFCFYNLASPFWFGLRDLKMVIYKWIWTKFKHPICVTPVIIKKVIGFYSNISTIFCFSLMWTVHNYHTGCE